MALLKESSLPIYQLTTILLGLSALFGCAAQQQLTNRPVVNLSPLDCGYRWFQTGYSEYISMNCLASRTHLKKEQTRLAEAHAAQVAATRCPQECPSVELEEPVPWINAQAEGVCREGRLYFLSRKFYECAKAP